MKDRALLARFGSTPTAAFVLYMVRRLPRRLTQVLTLIAFATITEGASLLLLVPILKLIDPTHSDVRITVPTGPLRGILGGTVSVDLGVVLFVFVAAVVLRAVLMRQKTIVTARFLFDLADGLRDEVFRAVANARWAFLARIRGSDIQHALTGDIDRVRLAATQLLAVLQTAVALMVYAVVALVLSPVMTVIALLIGVVVVLLLAPVRRIASRYGETLTVQRQDQYRIVSEFVGGLKLAKASNTEQLYVAQLRTTLLAMRNGTLRFIRLYSIGSLLFQVGMAVGLALFVWLGVGRFAIPYSSLIALVLLFVRLGPRVAEVQTSIQGVLTDLPAFGAMIAMRDTALAEAEKRGGPLLPPPSVKIGFENVCFRYVDTDSRQILDHVTFDIPANLVTAIIGPSGSGKSTLADLLMGLLDPVAGEVLIDGTPLTAANRRGWREKLAYVPQDSFLLHDTVAANLRAGRHAIPEQRLWDALEVADAATVIRRLPQQLETVVGDRGVRLSGGERQRVALARALLRDPHVLVLDEATSALDWESQAAIASAIRTLRGTMTIVTIAHRPSMIAFADRVVAIEDGRVIETGSFIDLQARPDSYLAKTIAAER